MEMCEADDFVNDRQGERLEGEIPCALGWQAEDGSFLPDGSYAYAYPVSSYTYEDAETEFPGCAG